MDLIKHFCYLIIVERRYETVTV